MTRIAINEALQSYRRKQSRQICQLPADFDTFASPNESPLQILTRKETTQALRRAVVNLPTKYRQALILHDLEELSGRETAQRLQLSVPAVKSRLFRARVMLSAAVRRPALKAQAAIVQEIPSSAPDRGEGRLARNGSTPRRQQRERPSRRECWARDEIGTKFS